MMDDETMILTALSSLSPLHLSHLTASLLSAADRHRRRIAAVLSSPILFSTTLRYLHSLSLPHKTLLIARHLLSSLHLLTRHFPLAAAAAAATTTQISHRDLDAALLLLLLCDLRHRHPQSLRRPHTEWRQPLVHHFLGQTLTLAGAGILPHLEAVARCWKFVGAARISGEKSSAEVAASPAAVVALPSVEIRGGGAASLPECVICKEEMLEGRDVCEFPCEHLFHWMCILPWLRKRNTCPCCRFALPTDDVYGEIQRLWGVLVKMSGSNSDGECR